MVVRFKNRYLRAARIPTKLKNIYQSYFYSVHCVLYSYESTLELLDNSTQWSDSTIGLLHNRAESSESTVGLLHNS